jgi:hypothetical protein
MLGPICVGTGGRSQCSHATTVTGTAVRVGKKQACRTRTGKWTCSTYVPSHNYFGPNPWGWVHLRKYPSVVNLGPGNFLGIPVWRIEASGVVNIQIGEHSMGNKTAPTFEKGRVRTTLLISRINGRLRQVVSRAWLMVAGTGQSKVKVKLVQWMRFSRYGETLHTHLPAACA